MLWGSDAMGGVINIVTKSGEGPLSAGGFMEYGSFASIREGGSVSGKQGAVDYSLSLSRWDTSSFSTVNYRRGATERDSYRNWQGSGPNWYRSAA
jgi:vitamin B12 transporter